MRLLIASTVPSFMEAFLLPFARHFRAKGWRVDAVANGTSGNVECTAAFDRVWDVKWSRNPLDPFNLIGAPQAINRIVETGAYDLIHVHTPVAGLVCRYAMRKRTNPVLIYTAHGFHFHEYGSYLKNLAFLNLEKIAGRYWTDYLVVINRWDEVSAGKQKIIAPERLVYMPGIGVEFREKYNPDLVSQAQVLTFLQSIGIASDIPVLVMIAEFIPRKRHHDALKAFARLRSADVHLLLAGSGPTMTAMKDLARILGIAARVHFLGVRRDIPVIIRSARALLLCSEQEGLPRCVMEAMALGTPVIGSNIRGTRDLLERGAGFLFPVGNIQQLAMTTQWVLDHPHDSFRTAYVARDRVRLFDIRRVLEMHEKLYDRAIREGPAGNEHQKATAV